MTSPTILPEFLANPKTGPIPVNDCLALLTSAQKSVILNAKLAVKRLIHVKSPLQEEWRHEGVVLEVETPVGLRYVVVDRIFELTPVRGLSSCSRDPVNANCVRRKRLLWELCGSNRRYWCPHHFIGILISFVCFEDW
jgi:hypothetical protein